MVSLPVPAEDDGVSAAGHGDVIVAALAEHDGQIRSGALQGVVAASAQAGGEPAVGADGVVGVAGHLQDHGARGCVRVLVVARTGVARGDGRFRGGIGLGHPPGLARDRVGVVVRHRKSCSSHVRQGGPGIGPRARNRPTSTSWPANELYQHIISYISSSNAESMFASRNGRPPSPTAHSRSW